MPAKKKKSAPPEGKIARAIVKKYVLEKKIIWPRDMKFAMDLATKYPSAEFWDSLEVSFQGESMVMFTTEFAKKFFKKRWDVFKLDIPENKPYALETSKVGVAYAPSQPINKPKSIVDFCK
jgi:hypothetical protein